MTQSIKNQEMNTKINVQAARQKFPKLPVVSRADWGCPDPDGTKAKELGLPECRDRVPTEVKHLIVHHTTWQPYYDRMPSPKIVLSIWYNESYKDGVHGEFGVPGQMGWGDIGYNYLIDRLGVIYEGRAGGDNIMGAHFSGKNKYTMGVALIDDCNNSVPTRKSLMSLKKLLAWKCDQRNIDPNGRIFNEYVKYNLRNIAGHRDEISTAETDGHSPKGCPGKNLYDMLPSIRNDVKNYICCYKQLPFKDISTNHWAISWIEEAFILGIMPADNLLNFTFNPERSVTRAETAKHLLQTIEGTDFYPPKPKHIFSDMKDKDDEEWAEELYNKGIAAGCSKKPLKFCPDDLVTRAEMAVFILKAIHEGESYSPPYDPELKPIFADLQADNWKRKWAEALYKEKLTSGCAIKPLRFCPDDKVKRSEMAVFLLKILEKLK